MLSWFWRKKRLVTVHHVQMNQSIEGVWDGWTRGGHYEITAPKLLTKQGQSKALEGSVLVPKDKVAFLQVQAEDAS